MPIFHYKARSAAGALVQGEVEARDSWLARKALTGRDLVVLAVEARRFGLHSLSGALEGLVRGIRNRVTLDEKLMLIGQIEAGFSIGVPVMMVLDSVARQLPNPYMKEVVTRIGQDVNHGATLAHAFGKHPDIFDPLAIGLIQAGERTGQLEATLSRLSLMLEQRVQNRARIDSATYYPKIVLVFLVVVSGVVVYFVIPKFKAFLSSLGQELPLITQAVVTLSDLFIAYWYVLALLGFAGYRGFQLYVATARGRLLVDRIKLRLPVIGLILNSLELNNLCVILNILLESGMTLHESLQTLRQTQTNQVYRDDLDRCAEEIRLGRSFGRALESSKVLPPTFTSMIANAEESGQLPKALQKLGSYYQIQVNHRLENLTKLIEPLLLSLIFVLVGTLALAVFLPMWKAQSAVSSGGR